MYIYRLEPYRKNRVKVYFDEGSPAFVLYEKEIEKYDIKEGQELAGETYELIKKEVLIKRAVSRTLYLLDASAKTESALKKKLREGFYPEEVIEEAVRYAKEKHYIDDEYYASAYAEKKKTSKSKWMIKKELQQKGIDPATAEEVFSGMEIDDRETIAGILEKKIPRGSAVDRKTAEKIKRSLLTKGFAYDDIRAAFSTHMLDITYKSD
ncbi:MAG: RecX family transcriptional regulator [Lachnospiraceae bacterium]|nr:RecX family transcriptional regulator [Lachnospiraceae bacterium]